MAKKKEEVDGTEQTSAPSKKKEVKSKPSREKQKPTMQKASVEDNVVKTLLEWIDEAEDTSFIFEKLMKHGYYQEYKTERELRKQDKFIPPKITRSEFKKIMEE